MLVATTAAAVFFVLNVGLGAVKFSPSQVLGALTGHGHDAVAKLIVNHLRLPGALITLVAGAMLGLAGAILQTVLRNPLVEPTLIAIAPGGVLFVAAWGIYGPAGVQSGPALPFLAVIGGLLAGLIVYRLSGGHHSDPLTLTLTGVLVGAMFSSVTALLLLLNTRELGAVLAFTIGSVDGLTWSQWNTVWPWALIAIPLGLASAGFANVLHLGDDLASGLGLNADRSRLALLIIAVVLTAGGCPAWRGSSGAAPSSYAATSLS